MAIVGIKAIAAEVMEKRVMEVGFMVSGGVVGGRGVEVSRGEGSVVGLAFGGEFEEWRLGFGVWGLIVIDMFPCSRWNRKYISSKTSRS